MCDSSSVPAWRRDPLIPAASGFPVLSRARRARVSRLIQARVGAPAILALTLLLAACGGEDGAPSETREEAARDTAIEHAVKHLDPKYVCPMHPSIVRDEPGTCPICGMTLVEKRLDPAGGRSPEVELSRASMHNMAVREARVERGTLWKYVRSLGRVEYDETRLAHVHPRAEGFIEGLELRSEGEPVRKGQVLARLYAPNILSAQVDFLLALDPRPQESGVKVDKARNILRLLDVPEENIRAIEQSREPLRTIPVLAPMEGVVTAMTAREGMYVGTSDAMFTIADLRRVWVLVDIFEHQIDWVAPGLSAEIRVSARPGRLWEGKVDYLYPSLDAKARTLRVRLVFDNPDGALKPNMFANVVIFGGPKREVLKIPSEALILTGTRSSVVKALGDGRFQPVDVVAGLRSGREVEILSGLEEGDRVVASGQFLIDSESSLQAAFQRMDQESGQASEGQGGSHAHH
ncbi:efflux RND transporter periplasmic adaptor subunit [Thiocystis violacea]|uniref:efflux RND transporter periplasmic adaptor subunit n=1 Tax=Thiocystis violacea TaxID=13725 RepID=UPI0019039E9E|nr:efflux RND transporter periplasmic adaptor subunit [Thiocystis violacea]MBK1718666.1 efflux transporter periplasmic adaptor subunit [Thiocystis violacea]